MFGTNITGTEYYTNRAIQAICRTRIRKHQAEPINVYISSDWSGDTVNSIRKYLNVPGFESVIVNEAKDNVDYMYAELRKKGITPKKAEQIAKLSTLDQNIFRAIIDEVSYSTELKLCEVFNILPMTEKKASKYNRIISTLMIHGVECSII